MKGESNKKNSLGSVREIKPTNYIFDHPKLVDGWIEAHKSIHFCNKERTKRDIWRNEK